MPEAVLEVNDAVVEFHVPGGVIRAVDGVSFQLNVGETLAIVGESGCGKTTLAKAILGLEPLKSGSIVLRGEPVSQNLKGLAERVGMVWQDPYASLDPRWRIKRAIEEPLRIHHRKNVDERLEELTNEVGLDSSLHNRFPHQLSGGQRQRVAIARALALRPPIVLCDEPTAALDLSIRAQILNLLKEIQAKHQVSFLYISHDLTTVRFIADRTIVMYLGRIVEAGETKQLFANPRHPYTRALIDSVPTLEKIGVMPKVLPGEIPDPRLRITGCRFRSRCSNRIEKCVTVDPPPTSEDSRVYFCHNPAAKRA